MITSISSCDARLIEAASGCAAKSAGVTRFTRASGLAAWDGPTDPEALQTLVFAVGNEHRFEPLRAWFAAIYEVLLGATQGPRFGGFVAVDGVPETIALIDDALAGRLIGEDAATA
jgi:lysyl-tRNA synthetase class 1